jgi:hypothetical protein
LGIALPAKQNLALVALTWRLSAWLDRVKKSKALIVWDSRTVYE